MVEMNTSKPRQREEELESAKCGNHFDGAAVSSVDEPRRPLVMMSSMPLDGSDINISVA